ncbi:NAD(P)/FAD-dependent oxidoreductase [Alteribacillus bidgolensis]|uniref:Sarcosine oxidase subunit alpha n=1 Tax=Alteribacillus bidgolensis TaxID=930129 RepID=A0A1G8HI31_9BACI|nr:NAD(P)/FAD-dependent oxidoreductase [Alteribacillus bidgolensis]SDI06326.1 sarcosine oxidase subunit alpha [Alteribacillus bidgolensis]
MKYSDTVIIGAGPAGLSAAITCAKHGVKVTVIDEFIKPGGRLLGQLHEEKKDVWWNGIKEADALYEEALKHNVDIHLETSVYNIEKSDQWLTETSNGDWRSPCLLLATGAAESPLSLPGWTLPGVMSIGAAQVMTNVHRVKVGKKGVIIGINPLTMAIARELQLAGIEIQGIYFPPYDQNLKHSETPEQTLADMKRMAHLAPSPLLRFGSKLLSTKWMREKAIQYYPKKGFSIWGIPLHFNKGVTEITGEQKADGIFYSSIDPYGKLNTEEQFFLETDFVCMSGGLYPLAELAAIAGCPFYLIPELGGHVPLHNETMKTPIEKLFVAGNITGIESAKIAIVQGETAGLSITQALYGSSKGLDKQITDSIEKQRNTRKEALIQFHPAIQQGREKIQKLWRHYHTPLPT